MSEPHAVPSRLDAISTRWSLLQEARSGAEIPAREARQSLVLRYRSAISRYVKALIRDPQDAEDLAQNVFMRLLQGDFAGCDPNRGRFRDLLKTSIRNMVRNYWSQQKRRKFADIDVSELDDGRAPDDPWLASWRGSVLDLTWKALRQEQRKRPGSLAYTVLRLRVAHPDDSSEQLAQRLSKQIGESVRADSLRQKLRRSRTQFVDLLIAEVASGLTKPTPERIEEELGALGLFEFLRL